MRAGRRPLARGHPRLRAGRVHAHLLPPDRPRPERLPPVLVGGARAEALPSLPGVRPHAALRRLRARKRRPASLTDGLTFIECHVLRVSRLPAASSRDRSFQPGRLVFQDNIERMQFLAVLDDRVARCSWSVRAYCLLSTHYHLLVATPEPDLSDGMQYLNGRFAQWANWHRTSEATCSRAASSQSSSKPTATHWKVTGTSRSTRARRPRTGSRRMAVEQRASHPGLEPPPLFSTSRQSLVSSARTRRRLADGSPSSGTASLRTCPEAALESPRLKGSDPTPEAGGSGLIVA